MRRLFSGFVTVALAATLILVVAPADAATRYVVTAHASAVNTDVGRAVTLRGKVSPSAGGQLVLVQRLNGTTWTTIKKARLNRLGRYASSIRITKPGASRFRVVKPRANGHPKGVSPVVTVTGWRWRTVSGLPSIAGSNTTVLPSGILGGQPYSPFIKQAGPAFTASVTYILDGKCTWLDLHVGGTADSANANFSTYYVDVARTSAPDTFSPWITGPVFKNSDPVHIVRGPDQVSTIAKIYLFSSIDAGNGVGWGAAKVYCRS